MEQENEQPVYSRGAGGSTLTWILAAVVVVAGVAAAFGYLSRERTQMRELESTNQALNTSLMQMRTQFQSQIDTLNQQVRERAAQENSPARQAVGGARGNVRPQTRLQPRRVAAEDPRIQHMQSKLADQERALNETRQDLQGKLDSTRDQLSGSLESTRSELSGSIARTHDDLMALQKRGERNYYEFQITRSKEFHRVGPVSVSLRKANTKRKSYDLALFVNDNELQKKSVNLFEPIWINLEDRPQPVELIVNQISKDQIQGYISEPKYKRSELGETTAAVPASSQAPALKTAQ